MKKSLIIIIIIVFISALYIWFSKKETKTPLAKQTTSIVGCYVAHNDTDIFTLDITSQNGQNISGTLANNFSQKDSSIGTINGIFDNTYLFGNYIFLSEGITSTMQVAFKKLNNDFIRGYGPLNANGTNYKDINTINYDATSSLNLFKKVICPITK